jgi:hypothetical protein
MGNGDNGDDFVKFLALWVAAVAGVILLMVVLTHLGNLSVDGAMPDYG